MRYEVGNQDDQDGNWFVIRDGQEIVSGAYSSREFAQRAADDLNIIGTERMLAEIEAGRRDAGIA